MWLAGSCPQCKPPRRGIPDRELRSHPRTSAGENDAVRIRTENEVLDQGISPCGGLHGGPSARREPEITNVARRAEVHRAAAVRRSGRSGNTVGTHVTVTVDDDSLLDGGVRS